ncbi:hypothetical protein AAMO2058_001102300 [Amorphochlora amoebiformis]
MRLLLLALPLANAVAASRVSSSELRRLVSSPKPPSRSVTRKRIMSCASKGKQEWAKVELPKGAERPKLVVFDLDNTMWTPELYQLQTLPVPGRDINLFKGARAALFELATDPAWRDTKVAAASRTEDVLWAEDLLKRFDAADGVTMDKLFHVKEIYPGSKRRHFERLKKKTGIGFNEMIFFDDSTWNTDEIEQMGVLCVFNPRGLTTDLWNLGLQEYAAMKKNKESFMGKTIGVNKRRRRYYY